MIYGKRAKELIKATLDNIKDEIGKEDIIYNVNLILDNSTVSDIRDEDMAPLVLYLMDPITDYVDKEYLIENCPELQTGKVFKLRESNPFEPIIKKYKLEEKVSIDETNQFINFFKDLEVIKVEKGLYQFMIEYIYDRLPYSMRTGSTEESVQAMFEMTKERK